MSTPSMSEQEQVRRDKLAKLRAQGFAHPNNFRPTDQHSHSLSVNYGEHDNESLKELSVSVRLAGRLMARRIMGKTSFVQLQDDAGQIQVFLNYGVLGADAYLATKNWDLGDLFGVEGVLFKTRTGELSIRAFKVILLVKCLHPLPEKWHGLTDKETRYRQRYLDLMVNPAVRQVFACRSRIVNLMRRGLEERHFMEVETPMLQVKPGGAAARPFITHHNALDMDLFLRIAPELHLKRLLVGGFSRVFEINRNFRNEGIDVTHNPEFTMVEFYQAYADVNDGMDTTEFLIRNIASCLEKNICEQDGIQVDLSQTFTRLRMDEAVFAKRADLIGHAQNKALLATICLQEIPDFKPLITWQAGHYLLALFEHLVEPELEQPTFITHYPVDVSPLARRNNEEPFFTDRFELFIAGKEIANGFSELNDADDQRSRFVQQLAARQAGDDEATPMDEDFVRALEYGLPPACGVGIGIDRLVMLLTNQHAIRDVLLFPHMRPDYTIPKNKNGGS
ncbi:MAG: lysine--tRNA ligase [Mariprofundales bacterium]